jgi:flagellar hook protein FlgE
MTLNAVMSTALSGMQGQVTRISATASNVANSQSNGYSRLSAQFQALAPAGVGVVMTAAAPATTAEDTADPLADITDLIGAELAFTANARAFETGADLWDMLAGIKRDE